MNTGPIRHSKIQELGHHVYWVITGMYTLTLTELHLKYDTFPSYTVCIKLDFFIVRRSYDRSSLSILSVHRYIDYCTVDRTGTRGDSDSTV